MINLNNDPKARKERALGVKKKDAKKSIEKEKTVCV